MYYIVLQRSTLYYNVVQCTTVYYIVLHRTTLYYNALQCIALYYTVLQCSTCTAVYYMMPYYIAKICCKAPLQVWAGEGEALHMAGLTRRGASAQGKAGNGPAGPWSDNSLRHHES